LTDDSGGPRQTPSICLGVGILDGVFRVGHARQYCADRVGWMSESSLPSPTRSRVVLLYGGRSSEHAISCVSAGSVLEAIDTTRWDVVPVGIARDGRWLLTGATADQLRMRDGELPSVTAGQPVVLEPRSDGVHLLVIDHEAAVDLAAGDLAAGDVGVVDRGVVDVVFPLLHGPWGEDGAIQGLLESVGVPYVGSGVLASAVAMDKAAMKAALSGHGIPIGPYEVVHDGEWRIGRERVCARIEFALELPVFVKPARAGSSIGISKVKKWSDLPVAIDQARLHDPKVVVEQGIDGAEIECGVLGQSRDQRAQASVCAQIAVVGDHEFYDFEAKYLDTAAVLTVPADLPVDTATRVREMAIRSFEALECEGLARVDFFVSDQTRITVNEVNTMPGFTPSSMFPRMWNASGIAYDELIDQLLNLALLRERGLR